MKLRSFTNLPALILLMISCHTVLATDQIRFGIIGSANIDTLEKIWTPFLEEMSTKTGYQVLPVFFHDYASVVESMRHEKIDLAWMGNRLALDAIDQTNSEVFAQTLNSDGIAGYYSMLITRKDQPFNNLEDFRANASQLRFGFGDPNSTSGTTVPNYHLFYKLNLKHKDFKSIRHASHEQNFHDVAEGVIDVATISSGWMQRLEKRFPDKYERLHIIWTSPIIPSDPLVWRLNLDMKRKQSLKDFLFSYAQYSSDKSLAEIFREKSILAPTKFTGFKASSNSQLNGIRTMYQYGQLESDDADTTLSTGERNNKFQKLINNIEKSK